MIFCPLTERDGKWYCPACKGLPLKGNYKRICPAGGSEAKPPSHGPGHHLSLLLSRLGFTKQSGCGCTSHAAEMDRRGPDWCVANLDTIVGWMRDEADKRGLLFSATAIQLMPAWKPSFADSSIR